MQTFNIWYKQHLCRIKGVILLLVCLVCVHFSHGQNQNEINLPVYDQKLLHYGFSIGVHSSGYKLKYAQEFIDSLSELHSIMPRYSMGFSVGFIVNLRMFQFLDLRLLPKVSFYQNYVEYNYISGVTEEQIHDPVTVEFPLLFKYKSVRRGNFRMYLVGGISPGFEAVGSKKTEDEEEKLLVNRGYLGAEFGFGLDMYFPLFKFSPEIRFSRGLVNMHQDDDNFYNLGIDRLIFQNVSLYLLFE